MHLMGFRSGEHGTFAGSRAVDDKAAPAFFDERLAEGVAFLLPIIDAPPMHDHWRRPLLGQAQMTDDGFVPKWNRYAFDRDVKIFRGGEKHLAGLHIAVVFAGRARKRVAGDAVVAIGF